MIASAKQLPKLKKRQLTTQQKKLSKVIVGSEGEQQAAQYLIQSGFQVLDTNVRYGNSEVDIVAFDLKLNELVFVEVKTRSSEYFGDPSFAVGYQKRKSLEKVAKQYLKEKKIRLDFRFDVVAILPGSIELFQNVTW